MGRKRKTDRDLPTRVYRKGRVYYFVTHENRWIRLGDSLGAMYRALADLVEPPTVSTVSDLVAKYQREVLPSYSTKEQSNRRALLKRITPFFAENAIDAIEPSHVRQFRDAIGERKGKDWEKPQLALKALSLLSHVFSWGMEWGLLRDNPCSGVRRPPQPRRTRYPTDDEFDAVYKRCPPMHQIAMDIALLTGLRRGDILSLTRDSVTSEGLLVNTSKTGKPLVFRWIPELKAAIDRALSIQPKVRRYIVCNRGGKPYHPDGFSVTWKRARDKAISDGKLAETFRFNDIRAKSASDDSDADRASNRLGHTSRKTTERYYLRKPKQVEPLRKD